jgi:hypothetical protein
LTREENLFRDALHEYEAILGPARSEDAAQIALCKSWEDLAALIQNTENEYISNAGIFRRGVRAAGDYASGFQLWAGLLPTDNNMSIMGGGIKLLLGVSVWLEFGAHPTVLELTNGKAAGRRSTQRERLLGSLRKVLDLVAESEKYLVQFNDDQDLRRIALALYVSMLRMIDASIHSLLHEPACKSTPRTCVSNC